MVDEPNHQRPAFRNPAAQQLSLEIADTPLSAMAEPIFASLFMQWEHEERLVVSRKTSQGMLEIGSSYQIDLENRGVLHSILFDSQRRVTVDSIRRLILDTIASFPVDAAPKKARLASAMLKPKPHPEHASSTPMSSATAPLNEIRRGRGRKKQSEMATPAG